MEERILEFIGDLRRAELRISTAEALDALAASAEVGLTDRETFKATLAATLVKEARDQEAFERIFNLYFLDLEALGVRPDAQHRGHGRRLMARVLRDADHASADCYLETSQAVNVPYYESMGFESLGAFAPLRRGGPPEARMRRARPV